jgi:hypothetical protein
MCKTRNRKEHVLLAHLQVHITENVMLAHHASNHRSGAARGVRASGTGAPKRQHEQNPHADRSEKQIDKSVEDSFPASDPPATGGTTRIDPASPSPRGDRPGKPEHPTDKGSKQ